MVTTAYKGLGLDAKGNKALKNIRPHLSHGCTQGKDKDDYNDLFLASGYKGEASSPAREARWLHLERPYYFLAGTGFTWWIWWGACGHPRQDKDR